MMTRISYLMRILHKDTVNINRDHVIIFDEDTT